MLGEPVDFAHGRASFCQQPFKGLQPVITREGVAHARAEGRVAGPKPKLTPEQVRLIRKAVDGGESVASVARSFSVSRQTVYRALDKA